MAAYFDTSAVLAFLLQQPEGDEMTRLWIGEGPRTSSLLLKAECLVNLRRNIPKGPAHTGKAWLAEKTQVLAKCLEEVTLKDVDGEIIELLDKEDALAECRTLDAIHLATAMYFRKKGDVDI